MSVDLENRYPHTFAIQLGADVIDIITGFGGVVTASVPTLPDVIGIALLRGN